MPREMVITVRILNPRLAVAVIGIPNLSVTIDHKPIADARVPLVNGGSRFPSTFSDSQL